MVVENWKNVSLSQYAVYTAQCEIEVNQCVWVNVHTGIFMVYQYFYGIPVLLQYVSLPL